MTSIRPLLGKFKHTGFFFLLLHFQEVINSRKEPVTSSYGRLDTGMRSSYSQLGASSYPSSSLPSQPYGGGYGSSGLGGGYSTFRL